MSKSLLIGGLLVACTLLASAPSAAQQDADRQSLEAALEEAYDTGDWERARDLARRLAEERADPYFDAYYGSMLLFGEGGPAEPERGVALIEEAARAGDLDAQTWLGDLYVQGLGVEQDIDRGVCLLRHAGLRGSLEAMQKFIANYRGARDRYRDSRKLFGRALRKAGDAMALFADALYLLGNERDDDDLEGLTLMLLADQRITEYNSQWARSLIRDQAAATISDFRARGRGSLLERAERQAAARIFSAPDQKPNDAMRFAACLDQP